MSQDKAEDKFQQLIDQASQITKKKKKGRPVGRRKRTYSGNGYTYINVDGKQVLEHRYLMEQKLKRKLLPHEAVFFIDGDKTNITKENLQLGVKPGKRTEIICPHCENDIFSDRTDQG